MRYPGQKQSFPLYLQSVPHVRVPGSGHSGNPDAPDGMVHEEVQDVPQDPPFVAPPPLEETNGSQGPQSRMRSGSIMKGSRARGESLSQMNRRVDFSLGAKSAASGDAAGDVYQGRFKPRVPIEVTEASQSRERETEKLRASLEQSLKEEQDARRSSGHDFIPQTLGRRSTDGIGRWRSQQAHRNRFFGHRPGTGDEQGLMESGGMADIPEIPSTSGSGTLTQQQSHEFLDPRSGMMSQQAWRTTTNQSNIHPPQIQASSGLRQATDMSIAPEGYRPMGRSQTDAIEMRRFH